MYKLAYPIFTKENKSSKEKLNVKGQQNIGQFANLDLESRIWNILPTVNCVNLNLIILFHGLKFFIDTSKPSE